MDKFKQGDQVAYVPPHTNGNIEHSDVEFGFIGKDDDKVGGMYFVRYWSQGTDPKNPELRTKACSQLTQEHHLVAHQFTSQENVDKAIDKYCKLHPCPICNAECVDVYRDVLDFHTLMEEGWRCPNDHYWYDYNTGGYREVIGQREFVWSYTTGEARVKRLTKVINKAIEREKRKWQTG